MLGVVGPGRALWAVLLLSLVACAGADSTMPWAMRSIRHDQSFAGGQHASAAQLESGRLVYISSCYPCHGMAGDGTGPLAHGMDPPPRDFRAGSFKFGSVRAGELPSDGDLLRIIGGGLKGTAMLDWDLPDDKLLAVVQFLKPAPTADGAPGPWLTRKKVGVPIVVASDPWADDITAAIGAGASIYHLHAQCSSCHPAYLSAAQISELAVAAGDGPPTSFRADMHRPVPVKASDNPHAVDLWPTDFGHDELRSVRAGSESADLYRVIAAGIGGAMPAWVDALTPKQIWALVHYVDSLGGA